MARARAAGGRNAGAAKPDTLQPLVIASSDGPPFCDDAIHIRQDGESHGSVEFGQLSVDTKGDVIIGVVPESLLE